MVAKKASKDKKVAKSQEPVIKKVVEQVVIKEQVSCEVAAIIPEGKPKSGRVWKTKQQTRFSVVKRSGMMNHLNKSLEEKQIRRVAHQNMKELEKEMKDERKSKLGDEKKKREEQQKRRMANEYKNSVYQVIKPETMKGMSKKKLRLVRKTAMNKNGQVELVGAFSKSSKKN